MNVNFIDRSASAAAASLSRDLLSLREVVVLADVSEGRVRKDIETGVLKHRLVRLADARLCFPWFHVVTVAAVYGNCYMNSRLRKAALDKMETWVVADGNHRVSALLEWMAKSYPHTMVDIDRFVSLDLDKVCQAIKPRLGVYVSGLARIEEKDDVLGGDAVFKGTRLSVHHVGKMLEKGVAEADILEDYPYLTKDDLNFARLYCRAHPPVGRPRASAGTGNALLDAG